jgi:hypothetical protein
MSPHGIERGFTDALVKSGLESVYVGEFLFCEALKAVLLVVVEGHVEVT